MEHQCPHCGYHFKGSELRGGNQPVLKSYRYCPHCNIRLTVDRKTRLRQMILIVPAIILLILFFIPSHIAKIVTAIGLMLMLLYVFYADKKIKFEEIDKPSPERKNRD